MEIYNLNNFFKSKVKLFYYFDYTNSILYVFKNQKKIINNFDFHVSKKNFFEESSLFLKDGEINKNNFLKIKEIKCENCDLYQITLNFINLENLYCDYNNLTVLNNINNLQNLSCSFNNINMLFIDNIINVRCEYNNMKVIKFSPDSTCKTLVCNNNDIVSLIFNTNLKYLNCKNNQITFLNVLSLTHLNCSNNNLSYLNLNNTYKSLIYFNSCNNNLKYIYIPYEIPDIILNNNGLERIYVYNEELNEDIKNKYGIINKKKIKLYKNKDSENKNIITCMICLNIIQENLYELDCEHKFHYDCIKMLVNYSSNCPCCRKNFLV